MMSSGPRWMAPIVLVVLLLPVAAGLSSTAPTVQSAAPPPPIAAEPTPGLIVRGHAWLGQEGGPGLAGVDIYRRYASYPGIILATTGTDGFYQSDFYYIPVDETVTVWAHRAGYAFEPGQYCWRHYWGSEEITLDFIAAEAHTCYLPLMYRRAGTDALPEEEPNAYWR